MNIELKPIAESKVRQLGGDVCGVLVRKDGKTAAVDEHGRVQWLQSGQGVEPVAWWNGFGLLTRHEELPVNHRWAKIIPLYTHPQPAQQVSVPEEWGYVVEVFLENVEEVTELLLSGGAADNIVALCNDLNKAATVAEKVLSTPQPEGDGWIKCGERLPTEADSDANGEVWWLTPNDKGVMVVISMHWSFGSPSDQGITLMDEATHWKPTGLKRPQPPKEGE
tara:strand:+ start:5337 stop:6002 length:666 start_codon:yes stop_codon:yes gene_type:complete